MRKVKFLSVLVLLVLLVSAGPGVALAQGPIVERADPTPVPPSFFPSEAQEMATTTERGIKSNEVYYSIAYFFSQYGQQVANYSSYSSAWLDNLWSSTWGSNLSVGSSKSLGGQVTLHTHGTHLFDYGAGNWVWRSSDDWENSWD